MTATAAPREHRCQVGLHRHGQGVLAADVGEQEAARRWWSDTCASVSEDNIRRSLWLLQRGSPESKPLHKGGLESHEDQKMGRFATPSSPSWAKGGRIKMTVYSWSLILVMLAIFLSSWFVQLVAGWATYNEIRLERLQDTLTLGQYLANADFWARTFQNWQSEFLAVGSMAVLGIYLRQRGSPESKPVGAPHDTTGIEG